MLSYQLTPEDDTEGDLLDLDSGEEWEEEEEEGAHTTTQPLWVLPLYSLLPSYKQAKVDLFIVLFSYFLS